MPGGRPQYEPSEKDFKTVEAMLAVGIPQADICVCLGIAEKTLRKHFGEHIAKAQIQANAKVATTMFQMATSGTQPAMTAMWMKCRMHWREPSSELRFVDQEGKDRDLSTAKQDLIAEIARVSAREGS